MSHRSLVDEAAGCRVRYHRGALSEIESAELLQELRIALPWSRKHDRFGPQSRRTYYCGDAGCTFSFVGISLAPHRWPRCVLRARARVARAIGCAATELSGCLLNEYPDGEGSIGWHFDEVRAHGPDKLVASLSLGGPRLFQLRSRADATGAGGASSACELELEPGSVLLMAGHTQELYEHSLPLRMGDAFRISLTFRSIMAGFEDTRHDRGLSDCLLGMAKTGNSFAVHEQRQAPSIRPHVRY